MVSWAMMQFWSCSIALVSLSGQISTGYPVIGQHLYINIRHGSELEQGGMNKLVAQGFKISMKQIKPRWMSGTPPWYSQFAVSKLCRW